MVKPDLISSKNIQKTLFDTQIKSPDEEVPLKTIVIHGSSTSLNATTEIDGAPRANNSYISPMKIVQHTNNKPPMKITPETSPKLTPEKLNNLPSSQITNETIPTDNETVNEVTPELKETNQIKRESVVESTSHIPEKEVKVHVTDPVTPITIKKDPIPAKPLVDDSKTPAANVTTTPSTKTANSAVVQNASRPSLRRTKKGGTIEQAKPPNILVYSDSNTTKENVISTLKTILEKDVYTIYPLATKDVKNKVWIDNATLLVVCGNVPKEVGKILLDYFLHGGKMFCLCSDVLHIVLPTYRMAEVRSSLF